jgi:hypothetical protein
LLNSLERSAHDSSTSEVKSSRISTSQEDIDVAIASVPGVLYDGIELCNLGGQFGIVFGDIVAKFGQDLYSFDTAMIGNEPSIRKGKKRNSDAQRYHHHVPRRLR